MTSLYSPSTLLVCVLQSSQSTMLVLFDVHDCRGKNLGQLPLLRWCMAGLRSMWWVRQGPCMHLHRVFSCMYCPCHNTPRHAAQPGSGVSKPSAAVALPLMYTCISFVTATASREQHHCCIYSLQGLLVRAMPVATPVQVFQC